MSPAAPVPNSRDALPSRQRVWAFAAAGGLVAAFAPTLYELVTREWLVRPEYSHGLLMVPLAAWLAWTDRRAIVQAARRDRSGSGWSRLAAAVLLIPVLLILLIGELQLSWYLKPIAFVAGLTLCVALVFGWRTARASAAPLLVLLLACPLPGRVQRDLTVPLKNTAAVLATGLLDLAGTSATLEGNTIRLPGIDTLWVADACSGIRSLISLVSIAFVACLMWSRGWLLKGAVLVSAVPVAVLVNSLRIFVTGVLSVHVGAESAEGFFHLFEGLVLFGVAALLLFGWALLLDSIFPASGRRAASGRPAPESDQPARPARWGAVHTAAAGLAVVSFVGAAVLVYGIRARIANPDVDPRALARLEQAFASLPLELDGGRFLGTHDPVDEEMTKQSGADTHASITYRGPGNRSYRLYIAGAVGNTEQFHAPSYCMPAAGWETIETGSTPNAAYAGDDEVFMRRLVMQKARGRMLVYYWFQAGDRIADHDLTLRWYRFWDQLHTQTYAPAVIVTLYVAIDGDVESTERAAREFLGVVAPHVKRAIRSGGIDG